MTPEEVPDAITECVRALAQALDDDRRQKLERQRMRRGIAPTTKPARKLRNGDDTLEDIEFILDTEPMTTIAEITERLGYRDWEGVRKVIARRHRQDLLDQLSRNSRVRRGDAA